MTVVVPARPQRANAEDLADRADRADRKPPGTTRGRHAAPRVGRHAPGPPRPLARAGLVDQLRQLTRFLGVGLSGALVNTGVLWLLTLPGLHVPYLLASAAATQVAIGWNFCWLDRLVFRRRRSRSFLAGLARFWLVNAALVPVQLGLLALLVEAWSMRPVPANVAVLAVVFLARYSATLGWVYGRRGEPVTDRGTAGYLLRLALPGLLTVVAFPGVALRAVAAARSGAGLASALAVGTAGLVLVAARSAPAPGEPDVHDRQLDVILAVPLLGAAAWLALGRAGAPLADRPLTDRDVIALAVFAAGASLMLLGTRLTGRIWWAPGLPLLGAPWLAERPGLRTAIILLVLAGAGLALRRHARNRPYRPPRPQRPPAREQPLPRLGVAAGCVAMLALALGTSSLTTGGTDWTSGAAQSSHSAHSADPAHRAQARGGPGW